jgi:hypothetical protein
MEVKVKHDTKNAIQKGVKKSNTKAFFISASFVYFVLATTPLLITIIRRENVPVVFQFQGILLPAIFRPRYNLPEIIPVKHFSAANPPPHQLSTYASPQTANISRISVHVCFPSLHSSHIWLRVRRLFRDIKIAQDARRKHKIINFFHFPSAANVGALLKFSCNKNQSSIIALSQWCHEMRHGEDSRIISAIKIISIQPFHWQAKSREQNEKRFSLTELTREILRRQICILLCSITLLLFSSYFLSEFARFSLNVRVDGT